uniref:Uncharacterized protein n=1 Tax=Anopheles coluzzii TaxID=1518534 RepID=A0A8W7P9W1_ANOCL
MPRGLSSESGLKDHGAHGALDSDINLGLSQIIPIAAKQLVEAQKVRSAAEVAPVLVEHLPDQVEVVDHQAAGRPERDTVQVSVLLRQGSKALERHIVLAEKCKAAEDGPRHWAWSLRERH